MDLIWIVLLAVAALALFRSMRAPRDGVAREQGRVGQARNAELAQRRWQAVRRVAEEDVTQLGQQIAATPVPKSLDPEAATDFDEALGAYERAKEAMEVAQHPDDLQWVTRSLDDGRFALAKLAARRDGKPLPSRRPACFFDQRHGLSVEDAQWAPPGGALRDVPVCAACQARIADGQDPQARMVPTPSGDRPYYDAGPEYGPWARGWYAASGMYMLNNMLLGTLLLNSLYMPAGFDLASDSSGDSGEGGDAGSDGNAGDAGSDGGAGDGGAGDGGAGGFDGGGFDGGGFDFGGF